MTHSSVHDYDVGRRNRLLKRTRQERAAIERLPELWPVVCCSCGAVLGLAEADQELLCRDCGRWVAADDVGENVEMVR